MLLSTKLLPLKRLRHLNLDSADDHRYDEQHFPQVIGDLCAHCERVAKARQRVRVLKRPAARQVHLCSCCRSDEHNILTCPHPRAKALRKKNSHSSSHGRSAPGRQKKRMGIRKHGVYKKEAQKKYTQGPAAGTVHARRKLRPPPALQAAAAAIVCAPLLRCWPSERPAAFRERASLPGVVLQGDVVSSWPCCAYVGEGGL